MKKEEIVTRLQEQKLLMISKMAQGAREPTSKPGARAGLGGPKGGSTDQLYQAVF